MKITISEEQERLARIAKALGHPTRVAIMHFLAHQQQFYFGAIHDILNISKPTLSQHLKELKGAGLIQGEVEPPKVRYCIDMEAWKEAKMLYANFFDLCQCGCSGECHCNEY